MTGTEKTWITLAATCLVLAACGKEPASVKGDVVSSGKTATSLADVPAEVLQVAHTVRPELSISEAEYEARDGREYYDVGGTLPDGSELELDMTKVDGQWTVVEIQRDIAFDVVPAAVGDALGAAVPGWRAERIIESDQGDGTVIYEFFGQSGNGEPVKYEVRLAADEAELLTEEWAH